MVALRKVVSGIAAAAVAFGVLAGCGEDGSIDNDDAQSVVNDLEEGADDAVEGAEGAAEDATGGGEDAEGGADGEGGDDGDDAAGSGDASEVQGTIDELLANAPIKFAGQSTDLNEDGKATLKEIATAAQDAGVGLTVTTRSWSGDEDKAAKLSEGRAKAIKAELVANGMAEGDVETEPLGNEPNEDGDYDTTITAK